MSCSDLSSGPLCDPWQGLNFSTSGTLHDAWLTNWLKPYSSSDLCISAAEKKEKGENPILDVTDSTRSCQIWHGLYSLLYQQKISHGYEGLPFVIDILADFYGTILSDWVRNLVHDREPTAVESLANFTWISPFIKSMLCVSALWVLWVVPPNGRVRTWQSTSCHTFGVHVGTLWCTLPCLDHNVQLGCGSGLSCIPPGVQVTGSQFWGSQFAKLLSLWITFLMKYIIFKFLQFGL